MENLNEGAYAIIALATVICLGILFIILINNILNYDKTLRDNDYNTVKSFNIIVSNHSNTSLDRLHDMKDILINIRKRTYNTVDKIYIDEVLGKLNAKINQYNINTYAKNTLISFES